MSPLPASLDALCRDRAVNHPGLSPHPSPVHDSAGPHDAARSRGGSEAAWGLAGHGRGDLLAQRKGSRLDPAQPGPLPPEWGGGGFRVKRGAKESSTERAWLRRAMSCRADLKSLLGCRLSPPDPGPGPWLRASVIHGCEAGTNPGQSITQRRPAHMSPPRRPCRVSPPAATQTTPADTSWSRAGLTRPDSERSTYPGPTAPTNLDQAQPRMPFTSAPTQADSDSQDQASPKYNSIIVSARP